MLVADLLVQIGFAAKIQCSFFGPRTPELCEEIEGKIKVAIAAKS